MPTVNDPAFWQDLYARGEDGWEQGRPAPPLVRLLDKDPPPTGRVAVLGCGRGHDAREFSRRGYDAVGYDFSLAAIRDARKLGGATFERKDIFQLPGDRSFDAVWEYTCFCAIDPARRPLYVEIIKGLLREGGLFLGLLYPLRAGKDGPPFPVSQEEIRGLFSKGFRWISEEVPADSIEHRRGFEWLVRLERRDGDPV